jgi:hypothetical protein
MIKWNGLGVDLRTSCCQKYAGAHLDTRNAFAKSSRNPETKCVLVAFICVGQFIF